MTTKKELRAMSDAATPGEWRMDGRAIWCQPDGSSVDLLIADVDPFDDVRRRRSSEEGLANAVFIVAARTAVPALLDENEALRAALKEALDIASDGTWHTVKAGARERIAELRKLEKPEGS